MYFPPGGIADRMIALNGFPFLDTKEEHTFHVPVSTIMTPSSSLALIPSSGLSLRALERLLARNDFQGFPIIDNPQSKLLLGYVGRTELRYAIDRSKRESLVSPEAHALFVAPTGAAIRTPAAATPPVTFEDIVSNSGRQQIDFTRFVNTTPITVHPKLPLETVMDLFKKMGPRVILVEFKGRVSGLVTIKDCLKYQFKVEAGERNGEDDGGAKWERRIWEVMQRAASWLGQRTGRRIHLGGTNHERRTGFPAGRGSGLRDGARTPDENFRPDRGILEGTEDIGEGVELTER